STQFYKENRSKCKLIGTVNKNLSSFVTTLRNNATGKCSFIDDTSALTQKTKNELVRFFNKKENDKKHVAYLVVPKESKGGNYGKK
ncbi:MAG: hypothetical protein J6C61_03375, partial [Clostridia bacterium]|nr:hypothetical protein [Clostridia bacterium]